MLLSWRSELSWRSQYSLAPNLSPVNIAAGLNRESIVGESRSEERGEGEESSEGSEESATQYALDQTFDQVRNARAPDSVIRLECQRFQRDGREHNRGDAERRPCRGASSNGIELGPTTPLDLAPGQTHGIALPASDESFESWSAHPEVG